MEVAEAVALPTFITRRLGQSGYNRRIGNGLKKAWTNADERPIELSDLRAVVFSDHHRGKGDLADDFSRCEQAYCAALGYYLEEHFELWLLGDVEELWENRPKRVLQHYDNVLELERAFGDGLTRFYGNHDMAWHRRKEVDRLLASRLPANLEIHEALKIEITDNGKPLGTLFLTHGHQGTIDSGNLLVVPLSRLAVRVFWGTLQRWRGFASTSPATNWLLRGKHDRAMAAWADARPERLILVSGHTHNPVFPDTRPRDFEAEAEVAEAAYQLARESGVDLPRARAERELANVRALRAKVYVPPPLTHPSYFNTGCCSFGDGDITGLEFSDCKVRLVRWLEDGGNAFAQELEAPRDLRELFGNVTGTAPASGRAGSGDE